MSDILGFVVSIALIYFGIKVAFKFIRWIGILLVAVFVFKMVARFNFLYKGTWSSLFLWEI